MLFSVEKLRRYVSADEDDQALEFRIQALENFICRYTNNNFVNLKTGEKEYPADVQLGAMAMLDWDFRYRRKAGISSETLSRHSVTYADPNGDLSTDGYPTAIIGFLKPYIKARF